MERLNRWEEFQRNALGITVDPGGQGPGGLYWHYLWNPSQLDSDLQTWNNAAYCMIGIGVGGLVAIPAGAAVSALGGGAILVGLVEGMVGGGVGGYICGIPQGHPVESAVEGALCGAGFGAALGALQRPIAGLANWARTTLGFADDAARAAESAALGRAAQVTASRAAHEAAVADFVAAAEASGMEVLGTNVTVYTPAGKRILDVVLRKPATNAVTAVEIKSSAGAMTRWGWFARRQFLADCWINAHGAVAVGEKSHIGLIHNTVKILWQIP